MKYYVATFSIACAPDLAEAARDLLAEAAGEAGFEAFEETDGGLLGYVQTTLFNADVLEEAIADFPLEDVSISYTVAEADYADWNAEWEEQGFEPIRVAGRCVIYDAKHTDRDAVLAESQPSQPLSIFIEARQAFGTGTHETTRMMLDELLSLQLEGRAVLDCGCGTGILGIAAAMAGAREVMGYDIDEWSADNARHNAALNGVAMDVRLGDAQVLSDIRERFDVVLANINRNILLADMPLFVQTLRRGGRLLLSGFYASDVDLLLQKAASLRLTPVGRRSDGDWTCLAFERG